MISKTECGPGRETTVRSNKSPLPEVQLIYNNEHWLTKAEDNYETNEIAKNIRRRFCAGADNSLGSANYHHDDNEGSCDRNNDDRVVDHDRHRNNRDLYARDRLHHVSGGDNGRPSPLLLHQRDLDF